MQKAKCYRTQTLSWWHWQIVWTYGHRQQGACFGVLQQSSKGHRLLGYFAGANQKIFRSRITRITARLYKEFEKWKATQWRLEPKGPLRFGIFWITYLGGGGDRIYAEPAKKTAYVVG